jgi:hypothetical protein
MPKKVKAGGNVRKVRSSYSPSVVPYGQPIVAVGRAPSGDAPFVPSDEELEEGIRAASRANEAAMLEEFRWFGKRD